MRAPVKLSGGHWPERIRELRWVPWINDPRVAASPDPDPAAFSAAMSAFHVGDTFKITARGRHRISNQVLIDHVDLRGATILDIGASDGGTSVDLIEQANADFAEYFITDRHLTVEAANVGRHVVFFDGSGRCILIGGPGYVAYPADSRRVARTWSRLIRKARASVPRSIQLINPDARRLIENDPRVSIREHDLFAPWDGPEPDVVKVANLLNRAYFSESDLVRAIDVLRSTVRDGGHLLIIDNPVDPTDTTARTGLYRRVGEELQAVATGQPSPEVATLIAGG